ncbi:septum formation inhibitor Maf [Anoxybacillus sp. UARK-01]|uniref:dTTP/UTP pyrophosphatase n=1 Tax=Anoxybacteroides rupiense TaxID=311460 RepID=A0ABD5IRV5_9BACL|nr:MULTISPECIES: Maf family protein [Anoxybacillus]MBB3907197.1 septum formation protein [Anoxybacillus rupiensis]MED5051020.1 Maf family protein [Anoxybacillus rupiensis]OQM45715.1 septum formation inhibitor Maf [Anoxybacillus sp. UARK-01]
MKLILASSSPRRKQLLNMAGLHFDILASEIDEHIQANQTPEEMVQSLAYQKAKEVQRKHPDAYVIGADTIVVHEGQALGKPKTKQEAFEMLNRLSGQTHEVFTGVAILSPEKETVFAERTAVTFWDMTKEEIWEYIETGEPMDKAGAYGIQGKGALFVKQIVGDYFSVVGLPLSRTIRELKKLDWKQEERNGE